MQETQIPALVGKDLTCHKATKQLIIFAFPLNAELSPGSSPNPQVSCLKRHRPAFTNPGIYQPHIYQLSPGSSPNPQVSCLKRLLSHISRVRLFATPWTAAYQAPLSMGFPRQEYWSGLPLPSPFKEATDLHLPTLDLQNDFIIKSCFIPSLLENLQQYCTCCLTLEIL